MEKLAIFINSLILILLMHIQGSSSTTFTFTNNCCYTVWPATQSSSKVLPTTGFILNNYTSLSFQAPPGWSGRIWARTGCTTDATGAFTCILGDCGSGQVECNGLGGKPPASLLEFTLQGYENRDFYDTSLVDGFNVPVSIVPTGVPECKASACPADINRICPTELRESSGEDGSTVGCKSACLAFGSDEYCCVGDYNNPNICKPSNYSEVFKEACPLAYSYAYDDATSTFTCVGADYLITFCPCID